jgi:hypothetical protein
MWNDEDNNPYGTSFERSDSNLSSPNAPADNNQALRTFNLMLLFTLAFFNTSWSLSA